MIAREDGQVVLVSGAIPGETVLARVERTGKGVAFARVVAIAEPSADRREAFTDPLCGGCLYAHVAYPRQLAIKSQVVADALRALDSSLFDPSRGRGFAAEGYRMRARLHVRGGRIGFFREGTHEICDARPTRQLLPETCGDVLDRAAALLRSLGADLLREIELSQKMSPLMRGRCSSRPPARSTPAASPSSPLRRELPAWPSARGSFVVILTSRTSSRSTAERSRSGVTCNRSSRETGSCLAALVERVLEHVPRGAEVVDMYAGVGLFSIAAAAARDAHVHAVEGDRTAATDLAFNAAALGGAVEAIPRPVESFVRASDRAADVLMIDPPGRDVAGGPRSRAGAQCSGSWSMCPVTSPRWRATCGASARPGTVWRLSTHLISSRTRPMSRPW